MDAIFCHHVTTLEDDDARSLAVLIADWGADRLPDPMGLRRAIRWGPDAVRAVIEENRHLGGAAIGAFDAALAAADPSRSGHEAATTAGRRLMLTANGDDVRDASVESFAWSGLMRVVAQFHRALGPA